MQNKYNFNKNNSPFKINVESNKDDLLLKHMKNINNINNNKSLDLTKPSTLQKSYETFDNISEVKIANIICIANIGCKLNLFHISCLLENSINISEFKCVMVKIEIEGKTISLLVFKTGKIICSGAKTETDSIKAIENFVEIIKIIGYNDATIKYLYFENFVGVYNFEINIDLTKLTEIIKDALNGELSSIDGLLIYDMNEPKITLLITPNGKIIFYCDKEKEKINQALKIIYPLLDKYKNEYKNSLENFNNT